LEQYIIQIVNVITINNMKERGIGLDIILFVVFLILKLIGNIDWSWWWVTSPLWIPFAIVIVFIILGIIIVKIKKAFS
jgi:hypothetical protein